ncbi:MAG: hypothetical protein V7719_07305 [Psychroserpens sp.]|uniref:hypothetical protein n=1 Tax=Psychroserpens sp. TaxID=2020870 RepID=UPI00300199E3
MKYILKFKRKSIQHVAFILPLICLVFLNSCKEKANSSDSELIQKVKAVQKQVMIQGNITDEERQYILSLTSLVGKEGIASNGFDETTKVDNVENAPVYPGCEDLSQAETKACFKQSIAQFFDTQVDSKIFKNPKFLEPKNIEILFNINKNGKMSQLKVRDADVLIQAEAARVIKLLPIMKPATQNGKAVDVIYIFSLPYGGE